MTAYVINMVIEWSSFKILFTFCIGLTIIWVITSLLLVVHIVFFIFSIENLKTKYFVTGLWRIHNQCKILRCPLYVVPFLTYMLPRRGTVWRIWKMNIQVLISTHLKFAVCNSTLKFLKENVFFPLCHLPYIPILSFGCCFPTIRLVFELRRAWNVWIVQVIVGRIKDAAIVQELDPNKLNKEAASRSTVIQQCMNNKRVQILNIRW